MSSGKEATAASRMLDRAREENRLNRLQGLNLDKIDDEVERIMDNLDASDNHELTTLLFRNALVKEL